MSVEYKKWASKKDNIASEVAKAGIQYVNGKAVFKSELETLVSVFKSSAKERPSI